MSISFTNESEKDYLNEIQKNILQRKTKFRKKNPFAGALTARTLNQKGV